jgi:uncharacterized protein involved in exopolysaccharide biosynthesis
MDFYRIWRIVVGYRSLIAIVTAAGTFAAVALSFVLPQQFEASSLVIVRPDQKIRLGPPQGQSKEVLDFPVSRAAPIDAPSNTYIEVLLSEAIAAGL